MISPLFDDWDEKGDDMRDGGKGHAPRPMPDRQKFEENFERIFGKKPEKEKNKE